VNLHENAREAVAPDTAQASRSSRIKVDAGIAGIEVGAGIEIVSRIAAEENAATATNDNDGAIPAEVRKYLQAVLHRQARRFGHRSERCASTSCAPMTDRGVRRQHRQPRGFTPVFGEIPL
jgi:hypothetical protein